MNSGRLICCAALTLFAGGCNTTTVTTKANTPVIVSALGMYSVSGCNSWEPPETTLTTRPTNGRVQTALKAFPITEKGHPCEGKVIDRRLVAYIPSAGFRGQDSFTMKYDFITNDGGGRGTRQSTFIVDVK